MMIGGSLHAQEVYRASWTIQDKPRGLRQDLARQIIMKANDWLTRDDPSTPTARLDDILRVTVVGEVVPATGELETHLRRLELGSIVIDTSIAGFHEFLDEETIASLIRRDHYWRDESVIVSDPFRSPVSATIDRTAADSSAALFERLFGGGERPRARIALDESSIRVAPDMYVWGGFGFDEIALPDFSYGRARVGLAYNRLRIWGELPTPLGASDNLFLARGLEGAYGVGISFEERWLGAMVSGAAAPRGLTSSPGGEQQYFISKAALLYGIIPIHVSFLPDIPLQAKIGLGYLQARELQTEDDGPPVPIGDGLNRLMPMVQLEYAQPTADGNGRRAVVELFGQSVRATYAQPITRVLGFRVTGAAHGVFGDRDPFLPRFSVTPFVTFTFR